VRRAATVATRESLRLGDMEIQGITIEVSDLARSKDFYANVLGFRPGTYYEPTKWQPYTVGGLYFAIREIGNRKPRDDFDITNFELDDVEALWLRVKDSADVAEPLATTPYGTYKFVIKDPDGYRLGFVRVRKD
jgi:catechol 2,3-dioxygenase-like lactoylglutathione lyase family enzyme